MLKEEIETAKRTVNTDSVQITIGELANMYTASELNINPEFQRLFRWPIERKSSFIESILIGIPIPPAFVYENGDGTWELIDGLQRISTVLEFMGVLKDPDTGARKHSKLVATKYLPSLEGALWESENQGDFTFDKALQLFFRRHRFDFQILKNPSNPKTKFDLFQRLNRGGAYANEQEVRTCSMVLTNLAFTQELRQFAGRDDFRRLCRISSEQAAKQVDLEYSVRMVAHTYKEFPKDKDVQEFLDSSILEVMEEQKQSEVLGRLIWTIESLFRTLGEDALIPPNDPSGELAQRFSLRALEGIAVGVARNMDPISKLSDPDNFIKQKVTMFWEQPSVKDMSASGLRGTTRLQRTVPFGAIWFKPDEQS